FLDKRAPHASGATNDADLHAKPPLMVSEYTGWRARRHPSTASYIHGLSLQGPRRCYIPPMPKLHRILATAKEYEAVLQRPDLSQDYKRQIAQALVDKRLEISLREVLSPLPDSQRTPFARPDTPPT